MGCGCGKKKNACGMTPEVVELVNNECPVLFHKTMIQAARGDDAPGSPVAPANGNYRNTLVEYEANGHAYLYSSDGIYTRINAEFDFNKLINRPKYAGELMTGDTDIPSVEAETEARIAGDEALAEAISTEASERRDADTALREYVDETKQNKLTAGDNISISNDVISAVDTVYTAGQNISISDDNVISAVAAAYTAGTGIDITGDTISVDSTIATKTEVDAKQDKLTAGTGIDITNDTVSVDNTIATKTELDAKQNKLTAGSNIIISGDTISASVPTVNDATLTIQKNGTDVETFTANSSTNKTANIEVPTKTSDLTNDGSDGTSTYVETKDMPTVDATFSSSSENALQNKVITNALDQNVMTDVTLDSNPSTTAVVLNESKKNLTTNSSTTTTLSLPVASSTQAGVMNSATFDAVAQNTSNINALTNGAVAITGLPAEPTQAQLTTAWQTETGYTTLMNRAGIYDVTNQKVWTYYVNDTTWHAAANTSQVTVNQFTNGSLGTIKGSTSTGQVFAENDGTGSVNGWDSLTGTVSDHTSKLATIEQGAEVNVQSDWTEADNTSDAFIKNKPQNLVQDANYVHTDNNFTTSLKDKLDGIEAGAEVNVQPDWDQTTTTADDFIKNKPQNLVQDASYVHTDNNFTTAEKNQISTNTTAIAGKQDTLVSGTNIKTINSQSLLGSGDLEISGGDVYVGDVLSQPNNVAYVATQNIIDGAVTYDKIDWSTANGVTEAYTIAANSWSAVTGADPFKFSATVTATHTIGANTVVELLNDDIVKFANYGFSIESISGQVLTIYAIAEPDAAVTLKVNYKG